MAFFVNFRYKFSFFALGAYKLKFSGNAYEALLMFLSRPIKPRLYLHFTPLGHDTFNVNTRISQTILYYFFATKFVCMATEFFVNYAVTSWGVSITVRTQTTRNLKWQMPLYVCLDQENGSGIRLFSCTETNLSNLN